MLCLATVNVSRNKVRTNNTREGEELIAELISKQDARSNHNKGQRTLSSIHEALCSIMMMVLPPVGTIT